MAEGDGDGDDPGAAEPAVAEGPAEPSPGPAPWTTPTPRRRGMVVAFAAGAMASVFLLAFSALTYVVMVDEHGDRVDARFCELLAVDSWSGESGETVAVFLDPDVSRDDEGALRYDISRDPQVRSWRFMNQAEALAEFELLFADHPETLAKVTAEVLPSSFRLVVDQKETPEVVDRYEGRDGVYDVTSASDRPPLTVLDWLLGRALGRGPADPAGAAQPKPWLPLVDELAPVTPSDQRDALDTLERAARAGGPADGDGPDPAVLAAARSLASTAVDQCQVFTTIALDD